MNLIWHDTAWKQYLHWQIQDKKTLNKINNLLKDIDRNGYNCKGKPEPLKGELAGWWSVRIDKKIACSSKLKMAQLKYTDVAVITATNKI